MVAELKELRALKTAHHALSSSYDELTKMISRVAGATIGGGRPRGRPAGSGGKGARKGKAAARRAGGKRFRSSASDVQKAYDAIAAKATKEWATKEALCKAAGYKPAQVAAAWKRLMEGGKSADGKSVKPVLESNGSRGMSGRYRRR